MSEETILRRDKGGRLSNQYKGDVFSPTVPQSLLFLLLGINVIAFPIRHKFSKCQSHILPENFTTSRFELAPLPTVLILSIIP